MFYRELLGLFSHAVGVEEIFELRHTLSYKFPLSFIYILCAILPQLCVVAPLYFFTVDCRIVGKGGVMGCYHCAGVCDGRGRCERGRIAEYMGMPFCLYVQTRQNRKAEVHPSDADFR